MKSSRTNFFCTIFFVIVINTNAQTAETLFDGIELIGQPPQYAERIFGKPIFSERRFVTEDALRQPGRHIYDKVNHYRIKGSNSENSLDYEVVVRFLLEQVISFDVKYLPKPQPTAQAALLEVGIDVNDKKTYSPLLSNTAQFWQDEFSGKYITVGATKYFHDNFNLVEVRLYQKELPPLTGVVRETSKEEHYREIIKASEITRATFPRREIESYYEEQKESLTETTEFLSKDRIRFESIEKNADGKILTTRERIQIGNRCHEKLDRMKWYKTNCDQPLRFTVADRVIKVREEYYAENSTLDSKPVKIFRAVERFQLRDSEWPSIVEFHYYLDFAGRFLKEEQWSWSREEKPTRIISTKYEYDVEIKPIKLNSSLKRKSLQKSVTKYFDS